MDAIKTASKRAIQKIVEATGGLIGNKIATKRFHKKDNKKNYANNEIEVGRASPKDVPKKDAYLQKKDNQLLMH